jgi:hypothetical protein
MVIFPLVCTRRGRESEREWGSEEEAGRRARAKSKVSERTKQRVSLPSTSDAAYLSGVGSEGLDLLDDVHAGDDLTEDNVLAIEPRGDDGGDEELGSVGVGSSVGRGEKSSLGVLELEVLVGELLTVCERRGAESALSSEVRLG